MLELALLVFTTAPEFVEAHSAHIKKAIPALKGQYRNTWAITGAQVKAAFGEPSHISKHTVVSAGSWHICWCDYEKLGIRVILYAENQLEWAVPIQGGVLHQWSIPEGWEVSNVHFLDVPTAKGN